MKCIVVYHLNANKIGIFIVELRNNLNWTKWAKEQNTFMVWFDISLFRINSRNTALPSFMPSIIENGETIVIFYKSNGKQGESKETIKISSNLKFFDVWVDCVSLHFILTIVLNCLSFLFQTYKVHNLDTYILTFYIMEQGNVLFKLFLRFSSKEDFFLYCILISQEYMTFKFIVLSFFK